MNDFFARASKLATDGTLLTPVLNSSEDEHYWSTKQQTDALDFSQGEFSIPGIKISPGA